MFKYTKVQVIAFLYLSAILLQTLYDTTCILKKDINSGFMLNLN